MMNRAPCPSAPGPLEGYAAQFDGLFGKVAQWRASLAAFTNEDDLARLVEAVTLNQRSGR